MVFKRQLEWFYFLRVIYVLKRVHSYGSYSVTKYLLYLVLCRLLLFFFLLSISISTRIIFSLQRFIWFRGAFCVCFLFFEICAFLSCGNSWQKKKKKLWKLEIRTLYETQKGFFCDRYVEHLCYCRFFLFTLPASCIIWVVKCASFFGICHYVMFSYML